MQRSSFDLSFLFFPLLFSLLGILFIYSATASLGSSHFLLKQLVSLMLGILLFILVLNIHFRFYQENHWLFFSTGLCILLLVLLLGQSSGGAQRWIKLGSFSLQPSELAKLFFLLALSALFARTEGKGNNFLFYSLPFLLPYMLVVLLQPDLGTSLVFLVIWASLLFASDIKGLNLILLLSSFLVACPFVFHHLKEYQQARLLAFLHPEADPLGIGYHLIQSKIAVGAGGLLGKGYLSGSQSQLHFIPGIHTDFIFSLIAEEMGFVGAGALLLTFTLFFWKIIQLVLSTEDLFAKAIALSIFSFLFFQFFLNIGMTIGIMPITGIPLPFISYGGSALITYWLACGVLAQISTWKKVQR